MYTIDYIVHNLNNERIGSMRGAILYFSGTGNTEFVAKLFKEEFKNNNIECSLVDVGKKKKIEDDEYDFFVLGSPIYAEVFPSYFTEFVDKNLSSGRGRKCIVFSTQAADKASGADILSRKLSQRGFEVVIQDFIVMPNNYYVVAFKKNTEEEKKVLKEEAQRVVSSLVKKFLANITHIKNVSRARQGYAQAVYNMFDAYSRNWAKKRLSVNMEECVRCSKCVKNCPTKNISLGDNITFKSSCISCQKCLHCCPTNAFRYKGKSFEQYKI